MKEKLTEDQVWERERMADHIREISRKRTRRLLLIFVGLPLLALGVHVGYCEWKWYDPGYVGPLVDGNGNRLPLQFNKKCPVMSLVRQKQ